MKSKKILIFNCGSSSIKYKIISMPDEKLILNGSAERVGIKSEKKSYIEHFFDSNKELYYIEMPTYEIAFNEIYKLIYESIKNKEYFKPDIIGHRYVHGGLYFKDTSKINDKNIKLLQKTFSYAPIHNPVSYKVIEECNKRMPDIPQYIVVDTSFHNTIPVEYSTYALPRKITNKYHIKKYGFHGTSHKYVMIEACKYLNRSPESQKIISCHLGTGGSSICAIKYGKSIDNTMGFTPLQGLIMNTRCGDIDPSLPFYIMHFNKNNYDEVDKILNKKSGLLGLTEVTGDMRDIIKNSKSDPQSNIALNMYINRVKEYIGAYYFLLRKFDILIFTDTLGTKIPEIRKLICNNMEKLGIKTDYIINTNYNNTILDISDYSYPVRIIVLNTDEEIMIARECFNKSKERNEYVCINN